MFITQDSYSTESNVKPFGRTHTWHIYHCITKENTSNNRRRHQRGRSVCADTKSCHGQMGSNLPLCVALFALPLLLTSHSLPTDIVCTFEGTDWCGWSSQNDSWYRQTGSTPSSFTGPDSAKQGSYYLYVEASGKQLSSQGGGGDWIF